MIFLNEEWLKMCNAIGIPFKIPLEHFNFLNRSLDPRRTIMTMTGDPPHVSGEKRNVDMDGH